MNRLAPLAVLLWGALVGCNTVLGIDRAETIEADASTSTGTAMPGSDAGQCSLQAGDPCNQCVAKSCCAEYDACLADADCRDGLDKYIVCLGQTFDNDAGRTCDEELATSGNKKATALSECVFQDKCNAVCTDRPVGDLCFKYCSCMGEVCSDRSFGGDTCEVACNKFTPQQLTCRPYHCKLAVQNRTDPVKHALHCSHASGELLCP
ncbi:MAG TPA: hypothetical protein VJT73_05190 [Polyangiaceae bacterium]|nr:hypothetical protein [Polyangiaceae bacterium]